MCHSLWWHKMQQGTVIAISQRLCVRVCHDAKYSKGQLLLFHNGCVPESVTTQIAARESDCYLSTGICTRVSNNAKYGNEKAKKWQKTVSAFRCIPEELYNCHPPPSPPPSPEKCHRQSGCTASRIVPQICDIVLWVSVTNTSVHAIVVRISLALFHPVIARNYEEITHRRAINTHLRDRHTETWL